MSYPEIHKIDDDLVIHLRDGSKKPIWQYRFTLPNGKYKRSSTKTTDKKKAIQIAVEARQEAEKKILQDRPLDVGVFKNMLFFVKEDVKSWKDSGKKTTYLRAIEKRLEKYKDFQDKRMDAFTKKSIDKFKRKLNETKKASTVNSVLTVLRCVFDEAIERGHITPYDVPQISNLSLDDQTIRNPFTDEEIKWIRHHLKAEFDQAVISFEKRLIKSGNTNFMMYDDEEGADLYWITKRDDRVLSKYYHRLFFEILVGTGMRPKSLINLKFSDFVRDKETRRFKINNVTSFKGKNSTKIVRTVIPTKYCDEQLEEMKHYQQLLKIPNSRKVFTNAQHSYQEQFERFLIRYNLKYKDGYVKTDDKELNKEYSRSLYSLRHSYITQRIAKGVSIAKIAFNCNTSSEMIEKHYNHYISDLSDAGFE